MSAVLPAIVGGAVALLVMAFGRRGVPRYRMARRLRRLSDAAVQSDQISGARKLWLARIGEFVAWLGLDTPASRRKLVTALARAGLRQRHAVLIYQISSLSAPGVMALMVWTVAPAVTDAPRLLVALAGVAAGGVAPGLWLANRTTRRQDALRRQFADMLDLYVICVEAGLSLDAAMARVAREIRPAAPELADELQLTAIELGFLPDRREAFSNLLHRVTLPEFRGLVGMFEQTEHYGTPLADSLRILSQEYRKDGLLKAEDKAARLPAILTVPMIIFILPPLFIVLIGPAILQLLAAGF
ncbi:MAG: type II secretion system F family protein [Sphingomonadaceae bacterium]